MVDNCMHWDFYERIELVIVIITLLVIKQIYKKNLDSSVQINGTNITLKIKKINIRNINLCIIRNNHTQLSVL